MTILAHFRWEHPHFPYPLRRNVPRSRKIRTFHDDSNLMNHFLPRMEEKEAGEQHGASKRYCVSLFEACFIFLNIPRTTLIYPYFSKRRV
jgi:hypothetical protein